MATLKASGAPARRPRNTDSAPAASKADTVLNAARDVFLAHGFSAATTDMIQREAQVSKSTVYAAWPTKEALFAAVIQRECGQFANSLRHMEFESDDITRSLTKLARAYLSLIVSPTGLALFRVIVAESGRFPELGRTFYAAGPEVVASIVGQFLERAAARGQIDVQAVGYTTAANLFISIVRGEAQLECITHPDSRPSDAQIDRWVDAAVQTFALAFVKREPAA
ncbi:MULTISPECIES: TetR/AcrR family transcriptional regulator [unclassified Paraburkholderia]|uniref:TetR/AcrR family transcriptional regulator n=1 Tax=unclassified Paraburkholderia TaxID=2615204 RepID=UPI0019811DFE|nr:MULTISPECIES: TetR/AcrR family transcriptional regulator [unclassified Paraburkholderia]MBN3858153.1 TetR/AcrR family transcriptional regulator [Paraburkholderia sp. Ac-20340]